MKIKEIRLTCDSFLQFAKKNKYHLLVALVFVIGFSLRVYKFESNLLFEIDQARDWKLAKIAVDNGWQSLPLLGPRAGGTEFRLGPITNYIHFLALKILGMDPAKTSYPDLIFSLLSIPLFLALLRLYFQKYIALFVVAIYTCSLFVLEYSRFGWNPNSIPFFTMLLIYSLIKFSTASRGRLVYAAGIAFSLAILVQLHTIMIVVAPAVIFLYLVLLKVKLNLKEITLAFAVLFLMTLPIITNELVLNFNNSKAFISELKSRNEENSGFSLDKKIVKGFYELSRNYYTIAFSRDDIERLSRLNSSENGMELLRINYDKKVDFGITLLISLLIVTFLRKFYLIFINRIESKEKRHFAAAIIILQIIFIPLLIFLAEKQDSRYYMALVFIPFVILGFLLELLIKKYSKYKTYIYTAFSLIILINLFQSISWLKMIDQYKDNEGILTKKEFILEPYFNVTLSQYEEIAGMLREQYEKDGLAVRLIGDVYHRRSIMHIMQHKYNISTNVAGPYRDEKIHYYLVDETSDLLKKKGKLPEDINEEFEILNKNSFGTLTIFSLKLKPATARIPEPLIIPVTESEETETVLDLSSTPRLDIDDVIKLINK